MLYRTLSCLLGLACCGLSGADWPQFRGPGGLGLAEDTGLPTEWSESTNVLWKADLPGPGTSSPIVVGERVLLTSYSGYGLDEANPGDPTRLVRHVHCFRTDGTPLWTADVPSPGGEEPFAGFLALHGYASSTPASDGQAVYVFFGRSGVLAYDLDGNQLWQRSVGEGSHNWGSATSPVLTDDLVIVNASVESNALVALHKKDGSVAWQQGNASRSWGSPLLIDVDGERQVVLSIEGAIGAFDASNGESLWYCRGVQDYVCPTLVAGDGLVYAIGGRQAQCLAVRPDGRGDVTQSHIAWQTAVGSNVTSPVCYDGHLYWISDRGIAYCVRTSDGQVMYEERTDAGRVYASPTIADGKIYVPSRENGCFVLQAAPQFEVLAHNRLDPSVANAGVAVHEGRLLIRTNRALYCLGQ